MCLCVVFSNELLSFAEQLSFVVAFRVYICVNCFAQHTWIRTSKMCWHFIGVLMLLLLLSLSFKVKLSPPSSYQRDILKTNKKKSIESQREKMNMYFGWFNNTDKLCNSWVVSHMLAFVCLQWYISIVHWNATNSNLFSFNTSFSLSRSDLELNTKKKKTSPTRFSKTIKFRIFSMRNLSFVWRMEKRKTQNNTNNKTVLCCCLTVARD